MQISVSGRARPYSGCEKVGDRQRGLRGYAFASICRLRFSSTGNEPTTIAQALRSLMAIFAFVAFNALFASPSSAKSDIYYPTTYEHESPRHEVTYEPAEHHYPKPKHYYLSDFFEQWWYWFWCNLVLILIIALIWWIIFYLLYRILITAIFDDAIDMITATTYQPAEAALAVTNLRGNLPV
jgi:hypothetical protein